MDSPSAPGCAGAYLRSDPSSVLFASVSSNSIGQGYLYGFIAWVLMIVLATLAYEPVRAMFFEVFMVSHWLLYPAVVVLAMLHSYVVAYVMMAPLALLIIDKALAQYRLCSRSTSITQLTSLTGCTRMVVSREDGSPFAFSPGQYYFVGIPSVSGVQYHPFSAACAPGSKTLSFLIKVCLSVLRAYRAISPPVMMSTPTGALRALRLQTATEGTVRWAKFPPVSVPPFPFSQGGGRARSFNATPPPPSPPPPEF